ncbi:MAG: flagellar motor protein [Archangiaceae bacterium]|nr:flagellar motor protein [Archangiaceae bacterium]
MNLAAALLVAVAAMTAAVPSALRLDRGAIAGRVCSDLDGDGRCQSNEPGLVGVRVLLETGAWAVTDSTGAYHFADLGGRTPEAESGTGARLVLGRHRVKLDGLTLPGDAQVSPRGATLELPMGALVTQDFAVAPFVNAGASAVRAKAAPLGRIVGGKLEARLTGQVAAGERVTVQGALAEVSADGVYRVWVPLEPGEQHVSVQVSGKGNRTGFFAQAVEVVKRGATLLVVPRELEPLGTVTVAASAAKGRSVTIEAPPQTRVKLGEVEVAVPSSGQTTLTLGETRAGALVVRLVSPTGVTATGELSLEPPSGITAVGLLDLEGAYALGTGFKLAGRGAGAVRGRLLGFDFAAELDLRDSDLTVLPQGGAASFFVPRRVELFERAPSVFDVPPQWADDSASVYPNASESRLRVELSREGVGRLGFGSYRAWLGEGAEIGRFHRATTAAYLEARTPDDARFGASLRGFYAPPAADPVGGLSRQPAHDRFEATGGSLFYLSSQAIEGSEAVRVELRDGVTGLPIGERHLTRGVDYSIDAVQGRILLARPLWSFEGGSTFAAAPPTALVRPVLWVDYERPSLDAASRVMGAEAAGRLGPVSLSAGYAEQGGAKLLRASATAQLGPVFLSAELARSFDVTDVSALRWSDDGGLTFGSASAGPTHANAIGLRARGAGLFGRGSFDVAFRLREAGFYDAQHYDPVAFRQISARVEQPFGSFVVGGVFDDRLGADATLPPSEQRIAGGFVGWERPTWGVRLEARDAMYRDFEAAEGGRVSIALAGRYQVAPWLTLRLAHRQRVLAHGSGPGTFDDTFASAGVDLKPSDAITFAVRGGWGPALGPQLWGNVLVQRGDEVWYGGHSLDVDAPALGEQRFATGVRREVEPGTAVFVEDVAAHDLTGLRLGRAVGLSQRVTEGLSLSARYERGLRLPADLLATRERDAGGAGLSWVSQRARAWLRAEVRSERGGATGDLLQVLGWGGAELSFTERLRGTLSALYSHTRQAGSMQARLFEGVAALAWRFELGMLVARYSVRRELLPTSRGGGPEATRHLASLLPSVTLFSRLTVSGGVHLQLYQVDGAPLDVQLVASLRPAVRIVGGLEVAAEVGRRSADPDGEGLTTLRGEVGYRYSGLLIAGGYTMLGYRASVMDPSTNQGRVYLRAEVAY